jgi:alkylation response protein AidB-like acyl-CoA dehydrogenase
MNAAMQMPAEAFGLNEEQQAFREAARDFADKELAPYAAQWDAEGHFPREAIASAAELGFCGLYTAEDVGGWACGGWMRRWCSRNWPRWTRPPRPSSASTTWPRG